MGLLEGIKSNISDVYNKIIPLTFGGSNDIIVIKRKDGTYKSTPFQLRFAKVQFYDCRSKTVDIYINGNKRDIQMKLTNGGDLYFENYEDTVNLLSREPVDIQTIVEETLKMPLFFEKKEDEESPKDDKSNCINWIDIEKMNIVRRENLNMRSFNKKPYNTIASDFLSLFKNTGKFSKVLNSFGYWEYLQRHHFDVYTVFNAIINNEKNVDGSSKSHVEFSNCLYEKIPNYEFEKTFASFITSEIANTAEIVVRISSAGNYFYFTYDIFNKIFWEIRFTRNKKIALLSIIEDFYEEAAKSWIFFSKHKLVNKDINSTLTLSSEQLESLKLKENINEAIFKINGSDKKLVCKIFLWNEDVKLVISDIDGTITKSNILGHIFCYLGVSYLHKDVVSLYNNIASHGYKFVYLSSRPLGQSDVTKKYLETVQQDNRNLPEGPVILNFDGIINALFTEIIFKTADLFKMSVLQNILDLFSGEKSNNEILTAGFGNSVTDMAAYSSMGISSNRIFIIDKNSRVEIKTSKCTYYSLGHLVDTMFPDLNQVDDIELNSLYGIYDFWSI